MSEQRDFFQVIWQNDLKALVNNLNFILNRISDRLDQLEGLRGTPTFYSAELILQNTGGLIWGDGITDGSWKIIKDGDDFKVQVLKNSVWTDTGSWIYTDY